MSKEEQFARAIGEAQYAVNGRTFAWYFMHMDVASAPRDPFVSWEDAGWGIQLVSRPCSVGDLFGRPVPAIDELISPGESSGRTPHLIDARHPHSLAVPV